MMRNNYCPHCAEARARDNRSTADCENAKSLLRKIQTYGFALYDTILFLDTHPTDKYALEYYKKTLEVYKHARAEYERKYGPLTAYSVDTDYGWNWVNTPEPWKYEAN